MMLWLKRFFQILYWLMLATIIAGFIFVGMAILYLEKDLDDVAVLKEVQLQTPLRILTSDGKLIGEYGKKRRIPIPFEKIPPQLINAVLATEDQRFYEHPGVDFLGLARASLQLITTGTKSQGGSTITMQVARNFFLSRKKTYSRKIKEILLAIKIDSELSKEKILDLYLNKIYFGNRAYGVGAAAEVYYGKPLDQLTLAQIATIAGLPKAPSALNPIRDPKAAKKRRNHVLRRMYEQHYITEADYKNALNAPINARYHGQPIEVDAPYVAEMVRNTLYNYYGEDAYTHGFTVYTTINSKTAQVSNAAVRQALLDYDRRHGYRGPIENLGAPSLEKLPVWLTKLKTIPVINELYPAAVIKTDTESLSALLSTGEIIGISWDGLSWARKPIPDSEDGLLGPRPKEVADILTMGDVIRAEKKEDGSWILAQVPKVEGALVSLDPENGAIQALVGGFDYKQSNFNRVSQMKRQAGSSFKPFIYAAALNKGFTLASVINDAPMVVYDPIRHEYWRPQNNTRRFYGPTRLREALKKSMNLVSIRLLEAIGVSYAIKYLKNFGFNPKELPHTLSLALGTGAITPLELADGYAVFANGGYKVKPYLIDFILDAKGETVYKTEPKIACTTCVANLNVPDNEKVEPEYTSSPYAPETISPQIAYLINSVLQDVITQGTARSVITLGLDRKDIAGKTGTTNDQKDAWFAGYTPSLVTVAWVGFDQPQSLHEYGSQAALPMWVNFMKVALQDKPVTQLPQPAGIITAKIDPKTGKLAGAWQKNVIYEIFRQHAMPSTNPNTKSNTTITDKQANPTDLPPPAVNYNHPAEEPDDEEAIRLF